MEIGQILYCLDGSAVKLCYFDNTIVRVEYNGNIYTRPVFVIGRTLFAQPLKSKNANSDLEGDSGQSQYSKDILQSGTKDGNELISQGSILYNRQGTALRVQELRDNNGEKTIVTRRGSIDGGSIVEYFRDYHIGRELFFKKEDCSVQKLVLRKDARYSQYFEAWDDSNEKIQFSKLLVPRDEGYERRHYSEVESLLEKSKAKIIKDNGGSVAQAEFFAKRGNNNYFQDIELVEKQISEPYFARVDYKDENGVYIGKYEVPRRVIDWTDERAALYYEYQLYIKNSDYGITLVRSFNLSSTGFNSMLDLYVEEVSDNSQLEAQIDDHGENEKARIISDPHLMKILKTERNVKKVHDIIRSIQANQYRIITGLFRKPFILVGCAGSGKTMILYHRIRYMMRNDSSIKAPDIVILSPTRALNAESDELTETLQLKQIRRFSTTEFYINTVKLYYQKYSLYHQAEDIDFAYDSDNSLDDLTLKRVYSSSFLDTIVAVVFETMDTGNDRRSKFLMEIGGELRSFLGSFISFPEGIDLEKVVNQQQYSNLLRKFRSAKDLLFDASKESIEKERAKLDVELSKSYERLQTTESTLGEIIREKQKEVLAQENSVSNAKERLDKTRREAEIYQKSSLVGSLLLKQKRNRLDASYQELLDKQQRDLHLAQNKLDRLQRELESLPHKPDTIRENIEKLRKQNSILKNIEDIQCFSGNKDTLDYEPIYKFFEALEEYRINGQYPLLLTLDSTLLSAFDLLESIDREVHAYIKFKSEPQKEVYFDRIVDYALKVQKKKYNIDLEKRYQFELLAKLYVAYVIFGAINNDEKFIFIDEFQDYSQLELNLLLRLFPRSVFTYYGDYLQCINPKGIAEESQLPQFAIGITKYCISENYRNAKDITEYLNQRFAMNMLAIGITGKISFSNQISVVKEDLDGHDRLAIVYKNDETLKQYGVMSNPIYHFMSDSENTIAVGKVNVVSVQQAKGLEFEKVWVIESGMNKNELYVAMSRALNELTIVR